MVAPFYTITITLLFTNSMVTASPSEEEACLALFNGTVIEKKCCDSSLLFDDSTESSKCKSSDNDEDLTCDDFKCFLEEDNIIVDDKISEEKAKEMLDELEKVNPMEKVMIDRVRKECLDGKYLKSFDDDINCEPLKFYTCLYVNTLIECSTWKKDTQCTKMQEYAQKCKNAIDEK